MYSVSHAGIVARARSVSNRHFAKRRRRVWMEACYYRICAYAVCYAYYLAYYKGGKWSSVRETDCYSVNFDASF